MCHSMPVSEFSVRANRQGDTTVLHITGELDLATVEPSIAGPKRPQDRVRLVEAKQR